ncbi:efflux RND transporter periplasmic adaptor subunit [Desulforhopalus sp. 52FAK]
MSVCKISFFSMLVFALGVVGGCNSNDSHNTGESKVLPTADVTVAQVTEQIAKNQIELVGTVQAVEQAEISSKISGNILSISVELGSKVKKNDLLVQLEAEEMSAQLQRASAQLEQAKRNLKREENLLKKNAATPETVKSLKDGLRIAEAAFLESKTMLNYTSISAPFDGIITQKPANTGDLATPGKPLLRIEGENNLQIITDIPEAMIHAIKRGDILEAQIPATNTKVTGQVTEISPIADPSSRTSSIKIQITSQPQLRSGQFARVTLASDETKTLVIPQTAILTYGQLERVFVAQDNTAKLRLVRSGRSFIDNDNNELIEILSGLDLGDTVITSGNSTLQSGQPLSIK